MFRPCHRISTSMSRGTGVFRRHASDFEVSPFLSGETTLASDALGLEGKTDLAVEIVIPAHRLLFRPVGVHDSLLVDAVFPDRVFAGFFIAFAARMRRTEVRPTWSWRAISALATPARCSFRISAASKAGGHRPAKLFAILSGVRQTSTNAFAQDIVFEGSKDRDCEKIPLPNFKASFRRYKMSSEVETIHWGAFKRDIFRGWPTRKCRGVFFHNLPIHACHRTTH